MQPIFTVQYAEFMAAEYLKKQIKNVSAYIPMSPQEKGVDFLICKYDEEKSRNIICSFQVKMSRSYSDTKYAHSLFFNTFSTRGNADWYILVGIYPENMNQTEDDSKSEIKWTEIMLAFSKNEMNDFLENICQKRDPQKKDTKFGFGFNDNKKILLTRGSVEEKDFSKYLIKNRITEIKEFLLKGR